MTLRQRYNHNTLVAGEISEKAQGNFSAEQYNAALKQCKNFIVSPTGGVYKRPGSSFLLRIPDSVITQRRFIEFPYDLNEFCVLMFYHWENNLVFDAINSEGRINTAPLIIMEARFCMNLEYIDFTVNSGVVYFILGEKNFNKDFNDNYLNRVWRIYWDDQSTPKKFVVETVPWTNPPSELARKLDLIYQGQSSEYILTFRSKPNWEIPNIAIDEMMSTKIIDSERGERFINFQVRSLVPGPNSTMDFTLACDVAVASLFAVGNTYHDWYLQAFSNVREPYGPEYITFHGGRMVLTNGIVVWESSLVTGSPTDFLIGSNNDDALLEVMKQEGQGYVQWVYGGNQLFVGTERAILADANRGQQATTIQSFQMKTLTQIGASSLKPIKGMDSVFFTSNGNHLFDLAMDSNGYYRELDLSFLADHLCSSGIVSHTWHQNPTRIYWALTGKMQLIGMTYLKTVDVRAWHHHELGGPGVNIIDMAGCKSDANDGLLLITQRVVNDEEVAQLEYIDFGLDDYEVMPYEEHYVDNAMTFFANYPISKIERGQPVFFDIGEDTFEDLQGKGVFISNDMKFEVYFHDEEQNNIPHLEKKPFTLVTDPEDSTSWFVYDTLPEIVNPDLFEGYPNDDDDPSLIYFKLDGECMLRKVQEPDGDIEFVGMITTRDEDRFDLLFDGKSVIGFEGGISNKVVAFKRADLPNGLFLYMCFEADGQTLWMPDIEYGEDYYVIAYQNFPDFYIRLNHGQNTLLTVAKDFADYITEVKCMLSKMLTCKELGEKSYLLERTDEEKQYKLKTLSDNMVWFPEMLASYSQISRRYIGEIFLYLNHIGDGHEDVGLDQFEGQYVSIVCNGQEFPRKLLKKTDNFHIYIKDLPIESMYVIIGYPYLAQLELLPLSLDSSNVGVTYGLVGNHKEVLLSLFRSRGGSYGTDSSSITPIIYQRHNRSNVEEALFTGTLRLNVPNSTKNVSEQRFYIEHLGASPFYVTSILQDVNISDGM